MSFASLCVFTYSYPVSFLLKCHAKNRKEVLAVRTSYCKEVLALLTCSRKEVLAVSRTQAQPTLSCKKNLLRTQKEVLARALFLGCTVGHFRKPPCLLVSCINDICASFSTRSTFSTFPTYHKTSYTCGHPVASYRYNPYFLWTLF